LQDLEQLLARLQSEGVRFEVHGEAVHIAEALKDRRGLTSTARAVARRRDRCGRYSVALGQPPPPSG